ncbi:MAG: serine/threonine-protein kinase [Isosphaeraceae bacterium]|nr:serine/threonine-protein kinase [Isosphaeraceae bacterium]
MIGTTFNQRFTLEKELGRGGMGAVYRATDLVLARSVAIKVLKEQSGEELARRLRLEAQILARLLHDNIVRLYDFGAADGTYFLVMEEVDGPSFSKRWRNIPLKDRLRIIAQVADALDYAHHQGVIHRDIKPGNVLLTSSDVAKLSDFGLSLIAEQADDSGAIRGTPHYMSPEQAQAKKVDHRSDLYSLGVMLYECATGACPFQGQPLAIIAQHVNNAPEPPRTKNAAISDNLESLILALLAKQPGARPSSGRLVAQALRDEIDRALSLGEPAYVAMPSATATEPVAPAPNRSPKPKPPAPVPTVTTPPLSTPKGTTPLVREMLEEILNEPLILTPDERYLCGHYLAFLLGGSRRRGLLLRRPNDSRNADRARLLLAMTSTMMAGGTNEAVGRGARLLEERPEVRAALNPVVTMKYLASRDTAAKRKKFRQIRKQLLDASPYAQKHMADAGGLLNPGLMPQEFADLQKVAPERTEVDDLLVGRWNRVAEVWRDHPEFRQAVLRYASPAAYGDPASEELWPEVVYPLIERARWQRQVRPQYEKVWDYLCAKVFHVPDAGVRLDRAIVQSVPEQVVAELDQEIDALVDDSQIEMEPAAAPPERENRLADRLAGSGVSLDELVTDLPPADKGVVGLVSPDPIRFTQGELRDLWQEAVSALRKPGAKSTHRNVPIGGPYRLAVIPSVRGRSAGTVAIQGMLNKQVEMLTPSLRLGGSAGRPIVAVWVYQDNSLAIAYVDFQGSERYILWHAPNAQQFNFGDPGELNHMSYHLGLEAPDQLDRALTKRFRPRNTV